AVVVRHATEFGEVVEIGVVVTIGALMLDGFPGGQQPEAVEAPGLQPAEMLPRLCERKGPPDEGDRAVIREVGGDVGMPVRRVGHLAVAAEIDATQNASAPFR